MRTPLTGRLARASARRPWLTIGLWAVCLAVALPLAGQVDGAVTPDVRNLVTTESDTGRELDLAHRSDGSQTYDETVVVTSSDARFGDPSFDAAVAHRRPDGGRGRRCRARHRADRGGRCGRLRPHRAGAGRDRSGRRRGAGARRRGRRARRRRLRAAGVRHGVRRAGLHRAGRRAAGARRDDRRRRSARRPPARARRAGRGEHPARRGLRVRPVGDGHGRGRGTRPRADRGRAHPDDDARPRAEHRLLARLRAALPRGARPRPHASSTPSPPPAPRRTARSCSPASP